MMTINETLVTINAKNVLYAEEVSNDKCKIVFTNGKILNLLHTLEDVSNFLEVKSYELKD